MGLPRLSLIHSRQLIPLAKGQPIRTAQPIVWVPCAKQGPQHGDNGLPAQKHVEDRCDHHTGWGGVLAQWVEGGDAAQWPAGNNQEQYAQHSH